MKNATNYCISHTAINCNLLCSIILWSFLQGFFCHIFLPVISCKFYSQFLQCRTGRLWWVTEQHKDGAKCGCAVLEGLSTFLLCCRLNVSLNELYHNKTNKNKDYNFVGYNICLCNTFFPTVLAAKYYFAVNKFKTIDKTKKINTMLCRLNLNLLAYLSFFSRNLNVRFWKWNLNLAGKVRSGINVF